MSIIIGERLLERIGEEAAIRVLRESEKMKLLVILCDLMNFNVIRIARASAV